MDIGSAALRHLYPRGVPENDRVWDALGDACFRIPSEHLHEFYELRTVAIVFLTLLGARGFGFGGDDAATTGDVTVDGGQTRDAPESGAVGAGSCTAEFVSIDELKQRAQLLCGRLVAFVAANAR
jgi:hypothetical protein